MYRVSDIQCDVTERRENVRAYRPCECAPSIHPDIFEAIALKCKPIDRVLFMSNGI